VRQVRSVLAKESTKANSACCASLMLRISRATWSRLAAMRSSAASTPLSRPANSRSTATRMNALGLPKPRKRTVNTVLSKQGSSGHA
jgi:hypothetical protein